VVQRRVGSYTGEKSVEERASSPFDYGASFSLPNHPVVGITWYEMLAFTRWLTKRWRAQRSLPGDWQVTLPSEAEWEKGARGGLQIPTQSVTVSARQGIGDAVPAVGWTANPDPRRAYPWIGDFAADRANVVETGIDATSAVGCFPAGAGPYAAQDLAGNIWEWTRSLYDDYPYPARSKAREKRERLDASTSAPPVLRGGAFYLYHSGARCAFRSGLNPDLRYDSLGFRVVVSPAYGKKGSPTRL
jgi:formylglycine-generating enzyme required for sulfatase activity